MIDRHDRAAQNILDVVHRMPVGHRLQLSAQELVDAFPGHGLYGNERPGLAGYVDNFLSRVIGSAAGNVRATIQEGPRHALVIITKHASEDVDYGDFVYHMDGDRQHLFAATQDIRGETKWLRRGGSTYEAQVSEVMTVLRASGARTKEDEDKAIVFFALDRSYAREAIMDAVGRWNIQKRGGA